MLDDHHNRIVVYTDGAEAGSAYTVPPPAKMAKPKDHMPGRGVLQSVASKLPGCLGVHVIPHLYTAHFLFPKPLDGDFAQVFMQAEYWKALWDLKPILMGYSMRHPDILPTMQPLTLSWSGGLVEDWYEAEQRKRVREAGYQHSLPAPKPPELSGETHPARKMLKELDDMVQAREAEIVLKEPNQLGEKTGCNEQPIPKPDPLGPEDPRFLFLAESLCQCHPQLGHSKAFRDWSQQVTRKYHQQRNARLFGKYSHDSDRSPTESGRGADGCAGCEGTPEEVGDSEGEVGRTPRTED